MYMYIGEIALNAVENALCRSRNIQHSAELVWYVGSEFGEICRGNGLDVHSI